MKLLKKLAPLGIAGSVVAGIVPTLGSCGAGGWVDGTKPVDTSKFVKCDKEVVELLSNATSTSDFIIKATNNYLTKASSDSSLIKNDFAYSMNHLCSVIYLLPDYLQSYWAQLIGQLLEEFLPESDIGQIILWIVQQYAYSPLKTLEVKKFKGKVNNFKIDANDLANENFKASYNIAFDWDVKFNLGLDYLPEDILDLIEYLLGLSLRSFDIEIKIKTESEIHNTPVVAYADIATECKTQMLELIDDPTAPIGDVYSGLSLAPYIAQNEEYLGQDKDWYMEIYPDIDIIFTNNVGSISLVGTMPKKIRLDHSKYEHLEPITNEINAKKPTNASALFIQSFFGWSTYYYSDLMWIREHKKG